MITRRSLVFSGFAAATVGCRKQRGDGYAGYAFVANEEGRAVAAVDLTAFAVTRHIALNAAPTAVIAHPSRAAVFALTPANGTVHEIASGNLSVARKVETGAPALSMRLSPDEKSIWVASSGAARKLTRIDLETLAVAGTIQVPEAVIDFDISAPHKNLATASHGHARSVSVVDLQTGRVRSVSKLDGELGTVRFRSDGEAILVANKSARLLSVLDSATGRVMVHLPLSVRPDNFCFNHDNGQLFITGEGRDAVVVVYPYYVPEVAETVLAGSRPAAMAATRDHLFVVNPEAGDVSILSILRRKVIAIAAVGADPGYVTVTPDNEYALVLNRRSGDMAVIRVAGLKPDRHKSAALFTMIPVGSRPVSAAIKAV